MTTTRNHTCAACGHTGPNMRRRQIKPPTKAMRDAALAAGLTLTPIWGCDDLDQCLRHELDRDTRRP